MVTCVDGYRLCVYKVEDESSIGFQISHVQNSHYLRSLKYKRTVLTITPQKKSDKF